MTLTDDAELSLERATAIAWSTCDPCGFQKVVRQVCQLEPLREDAKVQAVLKQWSEKCVSRNRFEKVRKAEAVDETWSEK